MKRYKNRQHYVKNKTKSSPQSFIARLFFVGLILAVVVILGFLILKLTGLWQKVNSVEKIKKIVESGGVFSSLVFMLLQILQTTVLQVPAIIVTLAGTLIFGSWKAFILSFVAVMIGSCLMFLLGRKLGKKFLNWLAGEEMAEKWTERLNKGKYLFALMMIFPFFPDDILCAVAGSSNMNFKFFFWINVVARSIAIGCTVFFGSGNIIPFSGWGLIVWAVILVFIGVLLFLSVRFQDKLDYVFSQMFSHKRKGEKRNASNKTPPNDVNNNNYNR